MSHCLGGFPCHLDTILFKGRLAVDAEYLQNKLSPLQCPLYRETVTIWGRSGSQRTGRMRIEKSPLSAGAEVSRYWFHLQTFKCLMSSKAFTQTHFSYESFRASFSSFILLAGLLRGMRASVVVYGMKLSAETLRICISL